MAHFYICSGHADFTPFWLEVNSILSKVNGWSLPHEVELFLSHHSHVPLQKYEQSLLRHLLGLVYWPSGKQQSRQPFLNSSLESMKLWAWNTWPPSGLKMLTLWIRCGSTGSASPTLLTLPTSRLPRSNYSIIHIYSRGEKESPKCSVGCFIFPFPPPLLLALRIAFH